MKRVYNQKFLNEWHRFIITNILGVSELEIRRVSENHFIVQKLYRSRSI
jgi:hypothetical protein